jgi:hypothetical protein
MQESYSKGVATRTGPESCVIARKRLPHFRASKNLAARIDLFTGGATWSHSDRAAREPSESRARTADSSTS